MGLDGRRRLKGLLMCQSGEGGEEVDGEEYEEIHLCFWIIIYCYHFMRSVNH